MWKRQGKTCNQIETTEGMTMSIIACLQYVYLSTVYLQLWERQSRFVEESEKWMWDDVTPSMMSDEEPMPDRRIARKRPCWRGTKFNELIDALDTRANSLFK